MLSPFDSGEAKLYIGHEGTPGAVIDFAQPAAIGVFETFARQYFVRGSAVGGAVASEDQHVRAGARDP